MLSYPSRSAAPAGLSPGEREAVRQVRLQAAYQALPSALGYTLLGMGATAYLGLQVAPARLVWPWVGIMAVVSALRLLLFLLWKRDRAPFAPHWEAGMFTGILLAGFGWALAPHLVFGQVPPLHLLFIAVLLSGVCTGSLATLGAHPTMALALIGPVCLSLGVRFTQLPESMGMVLASTSVLYFMVMAGAARRLGRTVTENVLSRLRAEEAQAARDRTHRHLQDTLQHAPLMLAIFDPGDRLIQANELYFESLPADIRGSALGRTHDEILRHVAEANDYRFPTPEAKQAYTEDRRSRHREPGQADLLLMGDRTFRFMDARTFEGGILTLGIDITADQAQQTALQLALEDAKAASQAKSRFLSHMSHELRTPLNAISGFTELLLMEEAGPLQERQKSHLTHVQAGAAQLLALITEVIDLARVESGQVELRRERFSVRGLADEALQLVTPQAAKAGVHLDAGEIPDLTLLSDRQRVMQVLLNFLSNAIKYNRPGGEARLEASPLEDGFLRLGVKDTGLGIPSKRHGEVFDAFNRLGRESGPIEGTGIGLHLTRRLVEGLGGRIDFLSQEGIGSHFWVDLPLH